MAKNTNNGWYSEKELERMGFNNLGTNVLISTKTSIYGCKNISLGNDIRIDDFSILAASNGELILEGFNHIGAFTYINCGGNVVKTQK